MDTLKRTGSAPLPSELRLALAALVARVGERRATEITGVSTTAIYRALAGLALRKGTEALVRNALQPAGAEAAQ